MGRFLREHGLTIALCGTFYFFGIISARYLLGYPVQDGMASLVGAALGAAITLGGSYWLIGASETYKSDRFKKLVTDNVRFIADQALSTKAFLERAEENDFQEHSLEEYALQTREQLLALLSSADLLGQSSPFAEIADYNARMALQKLEQTIISERSTVERERRWLEEHQTLGVLRSAVGNVGGSAEQIMAAANEVLAHI